jgi:flagellum-specific peptidoglycan hydrolase FlgJ
MFKKVLLVFTLLILAGCNSSQQVVRTTKKVPPRPKKEIARTVRKPAQNKPATGVPVQARSSSPVSSRTTEVIESTSKTIVYSDVVNNYVNDYKNVAMGNMKSYGIPASIILAQGILESGAGRGDLAKSANNHFGIKCHKDWTGETVNHDDDAEQECFRKYKDPSESYKDHALFLTSRNRYSSLFQLEKDDYEGWARGLRAAGYATDPKYPEKLISYIERYNLHQYDAQVLGKNYVPIENASAKTIALQSSDIALYEVQKGDTLYSISKKFSITVDELKAKNDLSDNAISIGQKLRVQ